MNMRELAIEEIMTSSGQMFERQSDIQNLHDFVMKRFEELNAMSDEELFDELQRHMSLGTNMAAMIFDKLGF